jgi:hypothetical protein
VLARVSEPSTSTTPAPNSLACTARVSQDRGDKVRDKPHVVVTHVLENVDEDQDPRKKEAKQQIGPNRDSVRRIKIRIKKNEDEQHQSRKEEGEEKEVEIHGSNYNPTECLENCLVLRSH